MVSERVIAMSFPSKGMMAMYRNNVNVSIEDIIIHEKWPVFPFYKVYATY